MVSSRSAWSRVEDTACSTSYSKESSARALRSSSFWLRSSSSRKTLSSTAAICAATVSTSETSSGEKALIFRSSTSTTPSIRPLTCCSGAAITDRVLKPESRSTSGLKRASS